MSFKRALSNYNIDKTDQEQKLYGGEENILIGTTKATEFVYTSPNTVNHKIISKMSDVSSQNEPSTESNFCFSKADNVHNIDQSSTINKINKRPRFNSPSYFKSESSKITTFPNIESSSENKVILKSLEKSL